MNGGYAYTSTLKAYLWPLHYEQLFRHNASAVRSSERLLHSLQSFLPRVDLDSRVSSIVAKTELPVLGLPAEIPVELLSGLSKSSQ